MKQSYEDSNLHKYIYTIIVNISFSLGNHILTGLPKNKRETNCKLIVKLMTFCGVSGSWYIKNLKEQQIQCGSGEIIEL